MREPNYSRKSNGEKETNMKNVYGLANAMKVVESACVEDEITIIGNGKMPTAEELYRKCVEYINSMYGVDILALVGNKCSCGCECCDEDEDEDEILCVNVGAVNNIVDLILGDTMSCLSSHRHSNIVDEIVDYYDDMDGDCADCYNPDRIAEEIYEILANNLELSDYDEDIIDEMIEEIMVKVYEDGISTK